MRNYCETGHRETEALRSVFYPKKQNSDSLLGHTDSLLGRFYPKKQNSDSLLGQNDPFRTTATVC